MIIDHGKVVYAENEPGGDVTVNDQEKSHMKMNADQVKGFWRRRCVGKAVGNRSDR